MVTSSSNYGHFVQVHGNLEKAYAERLCSMCMQLYPECDIHVSEHYSEFIIVARVDVNWAWHHVTAVTNIVKDKLRTVEQLIKDQPYDT